MFLDFLQCLSARRNPSSDDCVCIDHMWPLLQDYSDIIDEIKHHVSSTEIGLTVPISYHDCKARLLGYTPQTTWSIPPNDGICIVEQPFGFNKLLSHVKNYISAVQSFTWTRVVARIDDGEKEVFDKYRKQLLVDKAHRLGRNVHTSLIEYLKINGIVDAKRKSFKFGNIVVLQSKAGADARPQALHRDGRMSAIIALQDEGMLLCELSDGTQRKISFKQGQLLIFGKDFKHAGAAYNATNMRLHVFLESSNEDHGAGVTHDMSSLPANNLMPDLDMVHKDVSFFIPNIARFSDLLVRSFHDKFLKYLPTSDTHFCANMCVEFRKCQSTSQWWQISSPWLCIFVLTGNICIRWFDSQRTRATKNSCTQAHALVTKEEVLAEGNLFVCNCGSLIQLGLSQKKSRDSQCKHGFYALLYDQGFPNSTISHQQFYFTRKYIGICGYLLDEKAVTYSGRG